MILLLVPPRQCDFDTPPKPFYQHWWKNSPVFWIINPPKETVFFGRFGFIFQDFLFFLFMSPLPTKKTRLHNPPKFNIPKTAVFFSKKAISGFKELAVVLGISSRSFSHKPRGDGATSNSFEASGGGCLVSWKKIHGQGGWEWVWLGGWVGWLGCVVLVGCFGSSRSLATPVVL